MDSTESVEGRILLKIESCFECIVRSAAFGSPTLALHCRTALSGVTVLCSRKEHLRKFALIGYVLAKIYQLLQSGDIVTKRELYYQNKGLYGRQDILDNIISLICNMINEPRRNLNIVSTAKGLIYGAITLQCGSFTVNCLDNVCGTTVPCYVEQIAEVRSGAEYILVLEKAAVFQKLLNESFVENNGCAAILITGKGYPDVGTRTLLKLLDTQLQIPILCLTDSGVHGIEIMLTYKHGGVGKNIPYESTEICVPNLKWIGVYCSDIDRYQIPMANQQILNEREMNKVHKLLSELCYRRDLSNLVLHELVYLRNYQKKVEIEALENCDDSRLTPFVETRINDALQLHRS